MKPYSIIVEVVENSQARLIPLPVVWLGAVGTEIVNVISWFLLDCKIVLTLQYWTS